MKSRLRTILAFALLLGPGLGAVAGPEASPVPVPAPEPFLASLGQGAEPLSLPDFVDAALIVSGVPPGELAARRAALTRIIEAALAASKGRGDEAGRAEAVLEALHGGGVLRAYSAQATGLLDILDRGRFNCVSSALLYALAMKTAGIPFHGVRTPDHAFCVVRVEGREVDVETTNAGGFDPGTKKDFLDSFGRVTGYSYVPPGAYSKREDIGERRLLSLVLSNRSALLEESGRWSEALALAVSYEALLPGAEGRDFALGRLNNLAASLERRGDWKGARDLALEAGRRWGKDPRIDQIATTAADMAIAEAMRTRPFREALAAVSAAYGDGLIALAREREFLVYLYGTEGNRLGAAGDWLGAAALAEEGAAAAGGDPSLLRAAANFRHNFVAAVHNRFAGFYNARRFHEARAAVEEGLRLLPGDPTLQADLRTAIDAGG